MLMETPNAQQNLSNKEYEQLALQMGRLSNIVQYYRKPDKPYDYQEDFLDDYRGRIYRAYMKARQVGVSNMMGDKGILYALSMQKYHRIYVSMSINDAKEKINYANEMYEMIREDRKDCPEKIIDNVTDLKFSNGSRLMCMFTPRGKARADIDIDEFTFSSDPLKIYEASTPILIKGGTFTLAFTPTHSGALAHQIFDGEGGKYTKFQRYKIHWWDCNLHCIDVEKARREAPLMPTHERVERFGTEALKDLFDIMPLESFQQEFELKSIDDEAAWLSWKLIIACTPTGEDAIKPCDTLEELKQAARGKVIFAGYDVGRRKHAAELRCFVEHKGGQLVERLAMKLENTPFPEQEEVLDQLMSMNNVWLGIDQGGMGEPLAESMNMKYGDQAQGIILTGGHTGMRNTIASQMKKYMERGTVEYLYSREANFQMHSVKKEVGKTGNIQLVVKNEKEMKGTASEPHADIFWARAIGINRHAEMTGGGEPRIRVIG